MYHYQDILFLIILPLIGLLFWSFMAIVVFYVGTGPQKTYHKAEGDRVYAVYKYKRLRGGGGYEIFRFKEKDNKLLYLKKKLSFPVWESIVFGIMAAVFAIKAGVIVGMICFLYCFLLYGCFVLIVHTYNVFSCRRFLRKKMKRHCRKMTG